MTRTNLFHSFLAYLMASAISVLLVCWVMGLWRADLTVPLDHSGDASYYYATVKGIVDNGWHLHNESIGMPTGLHRNDFPGDDNVSCAMVKIISLFSRNYAQTLNLYFLLGFPLTTLFSMMVFRHLELSLAVSIFGSLLFTFLPYHFMRGVLHLWLSSYYLIPPMVMVVIWVFRDKPLFWQRSVGSGQIRLERGSEPLIALAICLLISSKVYYAFFGCFFLLVAGLTTAARVRGIRPLLLSATLIMVIFLGLLLNLLPHFAYQYQHGRNREAVFRPVIGAENYAFKICQLLFPVTGHRIPFLREQKAQYNKHASLINENDSATLGVIGSCGFLTLIAWLFVGDCFRKGASDEDGRYDLMRDLSLLNISAVLLASIGGFALLVGVLLSPNIRSYNRISVYIAFFSILAVAVILDRVRRRCAGSGPAKLLFSLGLALLLIVGILDQTTEQFAPNHEALKKKFSERTTFVREIESILPPKAMVFQLPYVPFPENPPVHRMQDYDHFKGAYLVSENLRWSYGAMKGREADKWQKAVVEKPLPEFLDALVSAGFSGIWIDRHGYADNAVDLEAALTEALGKGPMTSPDNRYLFFNLDAYGRQSGGPLPATSGELTGVRLAGLVSSGAAGGSVFGGAAPAEAGCKAGSGRWEESSR
jgi:hypothetical protein